MAKNELIIAQDLAEIKNALQIGNKDEIKNLYNILKREIKKYPIKHDIHERLESVTTYSNSVILLDQKINEINILIEILTSNK